MLAGTSVSIRPSPRPSSTPRAGCQAHGQVALGDLQGGDCTASGQPMPVLWHLQNTERLTGVQTEPLLFQLPLAITEKSLALCSLHLPFRYLYTLIISSLSHLFTSLNALKSLRLSSQERCSRSLIFLVALCCSLSRVMMSLLCWARGRTEHRTPGMVSPMLRRGEGSPLLISWQYFA